MKLTINIAIIAAGLATAPALAQDSFGGASAGAPYPQGGQYPPAQQPAGQSPLEQYPVAQYPAGPNEGFGEPTFPDQQYPTGQFPSQPTGQYPSGGYPPVTAPAAVGGDTATLERLTQLERQDFGVQPVRELHAGQMHGPTPASIPGGQVVTTTDLLLLIQNRQAQHLLFDVLGAPETLPNAMPAAWLSQPGSFNDQVQQQAAQALQQATGGRKDVPLVFYCMSTQCWMSYNAALRAINAGYTNVLWYRGGLEAWKAAGQRTTSIQ